jgi:hypothetical protein
MENSRQTIELGDIFRQHADEFLSTHKLVATQKKVFNAIMRCRTHLLGGHSKCCEKCGHREQAYNSCRDRHCPKCQYIKRMQWVDKLQGNLPPVKYFHIVFTIPSCLHSLFYHNQKPAYDILFKAAGSTLMDCGRNPKYLGAMMGAVAILSR